MIVNVIVSDIVCLTAWQDHPGVISAGSIFGKHRAQDGRLVDPGGKMKAACKANPRTRKKDRLKNDMSIVNLSICQFAPVSFNKGVDKTWTSIIFGLFFYELQLKKEFAETKCGNPVSHAFDASENGSRMLG